MRFLSAQILGCASVCHPCFHIQKNLIFGNAYEASIGGVSVKGSDIGGQN
jgi:hypothetical protein